METDSKATYYIDGLVNPDEEILILISSFWHTMMKILARASATKPSRVSNI